MDPRDSPFVSLPLRWRLLPFVAAAAAVITVYAGVLDAPFVFDDVKLVKENQRLRSGLGDPGKILETFDVTSRRWDEEELRPNYRPVRFLSYLLDYEVSRWWFGDPPGSEPRVQVFHATSILLHALNALLVVLVARSLAAALLGGARDDADPALSTFLGLCAGLLFALHPIETEAVTYISGRRDVLSTAFFLGALALHLRVPPEKGPGPAAVILVPLFLVLGFYSKEMVVTLPAVLLLADLARGARWTATRILVHVLSWGAAAVMTLGTISNETLIAAPPAETGPGVALTASRYVARYLGLVLLPLEQSVDYSFDAIPPSSGLLEPATTLPAVLLVVSILLAALWRLAVIVRSPSGARPGGALAIGGLWFLGTLVPVLQLVPIPERFAERFAYLPSIGIILVVASLLARARRVEKTFGWGLLLFLAVLSLALSVRRNRDWKTPLRLWTSAVEAEPRAARAHLGRANALKEEGRHREAVEEYTTALEIFGEKPEVPLHHGSILQALTLRGGLAALLAGEDPALLDRAIEDYRRVLGETDTDGTVVASSPRHVGVRFDLAGFLLRQGKVAEAEREYRAVIALPGCPVALVGGAHYYLGEIALLGGNRAAAAAAYRAAYGVIPRTDPSKMPVAAKLASLLIDLKDLDGAAGVVEMALADGARGQEKLGLRMLEAKILDRRGDLSGAISVLARILDLDPNHAPALVTLAGIEASQGKHESARGRYEAVLARDPGNIEALQGIQAARLLGEAGGGKGGADGAREAELRLLPTIHGRAVERLKKGELLAARDLFRDLLSRAAALGEKGRQAEAIRGIAAVEEKLGRSRTAEADLHKALELVPLDPDTHRQLGDLYLRTLGEPALARRHYDLYLESLPRGAAADPMVHYNLAGILEKAEPVRALGHLALARDGGHSSPSVDRRLGYLHAEAGQWEASLDAFNRYLEKAPPSSEKDQVKTFIKDSVLPRLSTQ